jgi:solute carrier family 25 (mitochondrial S-adenosylmethionine transporter), member 26
MFCKSGSSLFTMVRCGLFLLSFLVSLRPSVSLCIWPPNVVRVLSTKEQPQRSATTNENGPIEDELPMVAQHYRPMTRASLLAFGAASIPVVAHASSSNAKEESISGFVAGAFLSFAKTLVKYPLDTATVRLQMPKADYTIRDPVRLFRGAYDGVLSPLLANVPAGAVFFAVQDATKATLAANFALPRWLRTCVAVAVAQGPYWLVRNPSEVVKTRQQARVAGYDGVSALQAYQYILEPNNSTRQVLEAFYTGYWENIIYAYPADVVKFVCYEQLTGKLKSSRKPTPAEGAVAGAVATAVAQYVTTPLDVVRNRVMAGQQQQERSPEKATMQRYAESLFTLAREEGYNGLFAGASPRVGKAILSGAIQFATYEETKQELAKFFDRTRRAPPE